RCKIGNEEDFVSTELPEALEDTFAKAEYALKKPLSATTVKVVSTRID
ncbi:MAG: hypothetical protein ACI9EQ_001762, partial [Bacteroidia bacterium]